VATPAQAAPHGYDARTMHCDHWPRRRLLTGLAGLAGLAGLRPLGARAQAAADEARAGPPPPLGARIDLPEFALLDGQTLRPADVQGQVVVLYWWASWCPFCAVQTPLMDKLWQAERARGLVLLGLSIDRKPEDALAYLKKRGYGFPSAWVSPSVQRWLQKPKGLPVTVVLSRERRVVMSEAGQLFPEDVESIARLL
jgi:thiol-disulfide isomerase/thioredoxin